MLQTTIDKFGRIVIPKAMREDLGLHPGSLLNIEVQQDLLVLRATVEEFPLKTKEGMLVFTGKPVFEVAEAIANIRTERDEKLGKL